MSGAGTPFLAEAGIAGRSGGEAATLGAYAPLGEHAPALESFYALATSNARACITDRIPGKIAALSAALARSGPLSAPVDLESASALAASAWDALHAEVREMLEIATAVKLWLQLRVPRIEDGNNFGVGVQTELLGELSRAEDAALVTSEAWSKHLQLRAKLLGKAEKHAAAGREQAAAAYGDALRAADARQVRAARLGLQDVRDHYAVVYDALLKNMEKLLFPRSSNASAMY